MHFDPQKQGLATKKKKALSYSGFFCPAVVAELHIRATRLPHFSEVTGFADLEMYSGRRSEFTSPMIKALLFAGYYIRFI
jgi:hypothetical protein